MTKPRVVLISDIHFTPSTLELATKSLSMAMDKAYELGVPLVIAGDTLDSKAIIRGECANRLIKLLDQKRIYIAILVGNHDLLNEKGSEHSLNFLKPFCHVIESIKYDDIIGCYLIPYQSDLNVLQGHLNSIPENSTIITHQGIKTAYMGHYSQDTTSLSPQVFENFRVISGHYHRAQHIRCGRPRRDGIGLFSYIGNPYTLSFSEANDGPKGFQVLNTDGSLDQIETNLRKHVVIDLTSDLKTSHSVSNQDIIWIKLTGTRGELDKIKKQHIADKLIGHSNFKFDKIYTDEIKIIPKHINSSPDKILDNIIDSLEDTNESKDFLKKLWRDLL